MCFNIYPLYNAILLYCVDLLLLDPNILRDSILVRMEMLQFEAYVHVNAILWRVVYRELRALTNDSSMGLNPLDLNEIYEHLWNVGTMLQDEVDVLSILEDDFRPWPRVKQGTKESQRFYEVHDRAKTTDLEVLRHFKSRVDLDTYVAVLKKVFHLFGRLSLSTSPYKTT